MEEKKEEEEETKMKTKKQEKKKKEEEEEGEKEESSLDLPRLMMDSSCFESAAKARSAVVVPHEGQAVRLALGRRGVSRTLRRPSRSAGAGAARVAALR